jgi:polysaccharide export outer membrane protein
MRNLTFAILAFATLFLCSGTVLARVPGCSKSTRPSARLENSNFHGASAVDSPVLQRRDPRYRLYPSDEIAIAFPLTPEFNQTVTIEPDGYGSLAGAGDVQLAGLTTEQSAASIKAAYAKILHDPIITVELKTFSKPFFVVTGQVNHPGKYDLHGSTSASEALAIAGGMTGAAKASQALLFRTVDGGRYQVTRINFKRIFDGREHEDTELLPGDMLYVPKNVISKIGRFIPSSGFGAYYQLQP